ncbi:MAG: hypothetical protein KAS62_08585, partial [Candidatus Delongbacteria bacterium]|nr:hypothetical protein [Candidatus Delongbacteria bacterium]
MKELMTVGSFLNFGVESAKKNWLKFLGMIIFAIIVLALVSYVAMNLGDTVGSVIMMIIMILMSFGFIKNT